MNKTQLLELKSTELVDIIYKLMEERENLIKYLEDKINVCKYDIENLSKNYNVYFREIDSIKNLLINLQDLLERIKSGKY